METKNNEQMREEERYMIVAGLGAEHSLRQIAKYLNRSPSSILRELPQSSDRL